MEQINSRSILSYTFYCSNYAYLNHFHNFKCYLNDHGLKFATLSLDSKTEQYLIENGIRTRLVKGIIYPNVRINEVSQQLGELGMRMLSYRKQEAIYEVLRLGFDVIFADLDVIFFRNPVPFLLWKNIDFVASVDTECPRYALYL